MIDVTLKIDLVGANRLLRMHWAERKAVQLDYQNHLFAHGLRFRRMAPEGRHRVTITRILGKRQRRFDRDNLHGSVKLLVDALRGQNVIRDDNPAAIDLVVLEDASNRAFGPAVRVRVEAAA
jgi:hypothetical protein